MLGKCPCGVFGQLRQGKCIICNPKKKTLEELAIVKRLEKFKASKQKAIEKAREKEKEQRENAKQIHSLKSNLRYHKKKKIIKKEKACQLDTMKRVWEQEPHVSFINGVELKDFSPHKCAHVLPKGSYRRWKCEEFNIVLMTEGQHYEQHNVGRTLLEERHSGWVKFFQLQDYFKECYHRNLIPDTYEISKIVN